MLGDFEANSFRTFRVIGTQVHVNESPVSLIGDLRAQAIDLVVASGNAYQLRAKNLRAQNLRGLEISRDENYSLEAIARRLRRHRVGQVSGGRAGDGIETKIPCLGQSHCNDAVLKAKGGLTNRVVLQIELLRAQLLSQTWSLEQWGKAGWNRGPIILRQRQ